MKRIFQLLALTASLFTLPAFAASIAYKCTSETGEISFLDKKPTEGCVTIETVTIGGAGGGVDSLDPSNTGEASTDDTSNLTEQDQKEIAERKKKVQEDCAKRESDLNALRTRTQVIMTDPVTKQKKTLTPEEHQAKIREYEEYMKNSCGGSNAKK